MKFLTFVFLIVIFLAGFFLIVFEHELAHQQIFRSYGIDSKIDWFKHFPDVATVPEEPCAEDSCTLAHDINEVVGYTAQGIYIALGLLLIALRLSLEDGV